MNLNKSILIIFIVLLLGGLGTFVLKLIPQTEETKPEANSLQIMGNTNIIIPAPKPELKNLEIRQEASTKYSLKSLNNDTIQLGTEKNPVSTPEKTGWLDFPWINTVYAKQDKTAKPFLKLNKWDGEASLKVTIPFEVSSEQPKVVGEKLEYDAGKTNIEFLARTPEEIIEKDSQGNEHKYTINEEGGVEFNTVLKEKPASNQVSFPIESQDLDFLYQPPLDEENKDPNLACTPTECKDKDGNIINFRPENIVGSYAVYYKDDKSGDFTALGGKNYKAGKAFHIYRPKIWDSAGKEVYGNLSLLPNTKYQIPDTLVITIPQDFLDSAAYPVTIDPNFGYETIGATTQSVLGATIQGSLFTGAAGTVSEIQVYTSRSGPPFYGDAHFKGVMVLHSDLSIMTNGVGSEVAIAYGAAADWRSSTMPSTVISAVDYVVSIISLSNMAITVMYYDAGTTNQGHYQPGVGDNNYASPTNPTNFTHNDNKYSIYATYTSTPTTSNMNFEGINMEGIKIQ